MSSSLRSRPEYIVKVLSCLALLPARIDQSQLVALGAILLSGCGDPLVAPELIQGNRVLGARAEAVADSSQAWLAPSERAAVRWLLASPDGPPAMGWAFSICAAEPVSRGLPICAAPNFAHLASDGPSVDEPRIEFSMPETESLRGSTQVAVAGAFCESGTPVIKPSGVDVSTTTCPERSEQPLFATLTIGVAVAEEANANPSLESLGIDFDGTSWPTWVEAEAANTDCSSSAVVLPKVRAKSANHKIELTVPTELSEPLEALSSHSATRETLQLSHYVTGGDLERVYSTVDLGTSPAKIQLAWTAPSSAPDGGKLLRFYFVLRDGRGGADWTRRALCIVP